MIKDVDELMEAANDLFPGSEMYVDPETGRISVITNYRLNDDQEIELIDEELALYGEDEEYLEEGEEQ